MSDKNRDPLSFEELLFSQSFLLQVVIDLLEEKGLLTKQEILNRLEEFKKAALNENDELN